MSQIFLLFTIALALSMDTFSLSLGLGTNNLSQKNSFLFSLIVGLMHFFMPLIGILIGQKLINLFMLKSNFLLGIILIYLAFTMFFELIHPNKQLKKLTFFNMFIFAIGVSLDSFSTGIGLTAITNNMFMAVIIFSLTSFSFTYLGLLIGKYASNLLGIYATIFGIFLLLTIGLFHLFLY